MSLKDKLEVTTRKDASTTGSPTPETTTTHAVPCSSSHYRQQVEEWQEGRQDGTMLQDETMAPNNQKTGTSRFWSSWDAWSLFAGRGGGSIEQISA